MSKRKVKCAFCLENRGCKIVCDLPTEGRKITVAFRTPKIRRWYAACMCEGDPEECLVFRAINDLPAQHEGKKCVEMAANYIADFAGGKR